MADDFLTLLTQGRLKLYLGVAAGVGKTVAMLREAKRLRAAGVDVVGGLVETQGRADTAAEVAGLEVVPRRTIRHKGTAIEEMDLEAILARRPAVALVDEIAHTNAPGSTHAKRYEDVESLLDAGVSVIGTLNVQHLESLHDVILQEIGIDVRERVPDRLLHRADEAIVIDLSPEELRQRLAEGRLYPPDAAERALSGFFRAENLSALRRIALRGVVNAMEVHARATVRVALHDHDDERASERHYVEDLAPVMVCITPQTSATRALLSRAAKLAGGLGRVHAVYVGTGRESHASIDIIRAQALSDSIALAQELGANFVRLEGPDVAAELALFVREHGIAYAVFGRPHLSAWDARLRGSTLDRFMRLAPEVEVVVIGAPS